MTTTCRLYVTTCRPYVITTRRLYVTTTCRPYVTTTCKLYVTTTSRLYVITTSRLYVTTSCRPYMTTAVLAAGSACLPASVAGKARSPERVAQCSELLQRPFVLGAYGASTFLKAGSARRNRHPSGHPEVAEGLDA